MASTDTKHLKLRGNVWWYQRRIPKDLQDQFGGQTTIPESLGTGDNDEVFIHAYTTVNGRKDHHSGISSH